MFRMMKLFAGSAGFAALAAATPATAQYYQSYGYSNPYGYNNYNNGYSYGYGNNGYGYNGYAMNTSAAASQCTAAVNNRLYTRQGLGGLIGSLLGAYATTPRVVSVTRVMANPYGGVRVRGLASSGRYGYGYNQADLSFRCNVDANGYVRDVNINRRY